MSSAPPGCRFGFGFALTLWYFPFQLRVFVLKHGSKNIHRDRIDDCQFGKRNGLVIKRINLDRRFFRERVDSVLTNERESAPRYDSLQPGTKLFMRTHSTPQSALNLEFTKLAIIECIASVAVYVGVAMYFGTFKYLAAAVVLAPLMLFRTDASANWGLNVYERFWERVDRLPNLVSILVTLIGAPVVATALRIVATLYWAARSPLQTLNEMPGNWLRQCFCTDFFHLPEMLPLEAARGDATKILTFADMWAGIRDDKSVVSKVVLFLLCSPIFLIGYLPPLIYRVTFKATAVAYAPFVWVAHTTLRNPLSLTLRLERITKGELEKVRRGFSWIIVATLAGKLGLIWGLVDRSRIVEKFPSQKFVESLVVIDLWPWWQITLGTDALLTFFLLFFADAALARVDSQRVWQEETVLKTLSTTAFLRAALSIVTMSHFFYVALVSVAPAWALRLLS